MAEKPAKFDSAQFDAAADELYSLAPSDFVARRSELVSTLKKSGDKAVATRVGALRKPTVVAWLVNNLARRDAAEMTDLFDLGEELNRAQQHSEGRKLRELSAARGSLIRSLTNRAIELGNDAGASVGDGAAREIGNTLNAALADPDIGERVRAGRTVVAESYSGFGPALLSLVPDGEDDSMQPAEPAESVEVADEPEEDVEPEFDPKAERKRREVEEELEAAEAELDAARELANSAETDAGDASTELREAKQNLERLRKELHNAETDEAAARKAERASAAHARLMRRTLEDASRRTAELKAALEELA